MSLSGSGMDQLQRGGVGWVAPVEGRRTAAPDRDLSVVVLAGGLAFEREVSLRSGRRVAAALRSVGLHIRELDADPELLPALANEPPDAAPPP